METAQKTGLSRSYENLTYQVGWGNHFATEAKPGALPIGQNNPQVVKYGLYTEQISGTAFTVPRAANQRTWEYKIMPTAAHKPFKKSDMSKFKLIKNDFFNKEGTATTPQQIRWKPFDLPTKENPKTFVEGLVTLLGAGDPSIRNGLVIYQYCCNKSMHNSAFYSSDGDFLIVPQMGTLYLTTELGKMTVKSREICVIPRGIRFAVEVTEACRGWIAETFKGHFKIPDLGPIGANGLANPRDFEIPVAFYEDKSETFTIYNKYIGEIFEHEQDHSCFDCVAWHGNYYPYKYNLDRFNAMNTVTFDHPDPSIFTVLTCATDEPGVAVMDFAIFPPRWMVAEHTFRPPYYHRNVASEFMGNISGSYDAKEEGFGPGASSLHSYLTGHGPEVQAFEKSSTMELKPVRYPYENLSFMFESSFQLKATTWVMEEKLIDTEYWKCWSGFKKHFKE